MACITSLQEDAVRNEWIGMNVQTGETKVFKTLDDYKRYTKSLEDQGRFCADVTPVNDVRYFRNENTTPTGFMEFRPRDPITQARFDPMSKSWEGAEASMLAVKQGLFAEDSADLKSREIRSQPMYLPKQGPEAPVTIWDTIKGYWNYYLG